MINNPAFHILNGNYVIPVPKGIYAVGVEPVDGNPTDADNINLTCRIGSFFGQQNFNEEFYNRSREDAREVRLGEKFPVLVLPGLNLSSGVDIVTSDSININNFGDRDTLGFSNACARDSVCRADPGLADHRGQSRRRPPHSGSRI